MYHTYRLTFDSNYRFAWTLYGETPKGVWQVLNVFELQAEAEGRIQYEVQLENTATYYDSFGRKIQK